MAPHAQQSEASPAQQSVAPSSLTSSSIHPLVTCNHNGTQCAKVPYSLYSVYHPLPSTYALLASFPLCEPTSFKEAYNLYEHTSFKEAYKDSRCISAMQDEYRAFVQNKTWTLVPCESLMNIIRYRWVYKIKKKEGLMVSLSGTKHS